MSIYEPEIDALQDAPPPQPVKRYQRVKNRNRAEFAQMALEGYAHAKEGRNYDPLEEMAPDLICDLLHLIRRETRDPGRALSALQTAQINFEAEEEGEE